VHAPWTVLDVDFIFRQKVKPPPLLTYWFRRFLQKREGCVICADDNFPSQQMLTILLQAVNYAKKFFPGNAIASFSTRESATRITYYTKLSVLFLLKNGA